MTDAPKKRRPRGDAAIFQRASDGLFVGHVELPKDPMSGKRKRKQFTGKTRKIVKDKMVAWSATNDTGRGQTREYTVGQWIDWWLEHYAAKSLTPAAFKGYVSQSKHVKAALGTKKMNDVAAEDIILFHQYLMSYKGLSAAYTTTIHHMLSSAFTDAVGANRAKHNPCKSVRVPGRDPVELETLEVAQAKAILAREVMAERNGSTWAFALLTGARRGEILGLTWDRVDFEANTIDLSWQLQRHNWEHGCAPFGKPRACDWASAYKCPERKITHKRDWEHVYLEDSFWLASPKTSSGDRIIPLVDPLRAILIRHREQTRLDPNPYNLVWTADPRTPRGGRGEKYMDGRPVDPDKHTRVWHDVQDRAGIPADEHTRGHDLRHTAVTLLFDLGVPEHLIPDIVGHSAVTMSRKYRNKARKRAALSAPMIEAMRALGRELDFTDPNMPLMLETVSDRLDLETAGETFVLEGRDDDEDGGLLVAA